MLKHVIFFFISYLLVLPNPASSSPIYFDFRDPGIEALDEGSSFSLNVADLVLFVSTSSGVLNRTAAGFGVNAAGAGDDTDALDGGSGMPESISFRFNNDIYLNGFTVSGLGNNDIGGYQYDGLTLSEFTSTGFISLGNTLLPGGNSLAIHYIAGNGFSLDNLVISPFSVPEPATGLLLVLSVIMLGCNRRLKINSGVGRAIKT